MGYFNHVQNLISTAKEKTDAKSMHVNKSSKPGSLWDYKSGKCLLTFFLPWKHSQNIVYDDIKQIKNKLYVYLTYNPKFTRNVNVRYFILSYWLCYEQPDVCRALGS